MEDKYKFEMECKPNFDDKAEVSCTVKDSEGASGEFKTTAKDGNIKMVFEGNKKLMELAMKRQK